MKRLSASDSSTPTTITAIPARAVRTCRRANPMMPTTSTAMASDHVWIRSRLSSASVASQGRTWPEPAIAAFSHSCPHTVNTAITYTTMKPTTHAAARITHRLAALDSAAADVFSRGPACFALLTAYCPLCRWSFRRNSSGLGDGATAPKPNVRGACRLQDERAFGALKLSG